MGAGIATRNIRAWRDPLVRLAEGSVTDGKPRSWIMIAPVGHFQHEKYGDLNFTAQKLAEMKRNFDERVRHIDIALDVDHDQGAATGWLEEMQLRAADAASDTPAGLWGLVRWTPYGAKLLQEETYRYFSPEFGDWQDPESGKVYHNVLMGGALTNRPFLKTMGDVHLSERERGTWYTVKLTQERAAQTLRLLEHRVERALQLMEVSNKPWGSIDKSCLPRSCFLIQGDPDHKDTWKLPVYEGAGAKDADGHYTKRGPLNINGVRAALAAIGGARTGTPMSGVNSGIRAKLQRWLDQYGGSGSGGSKAASEEGVRTMARTPKRSRLGQRVEDERNLKLLNQADPGDEDEDEDDEEEGELGDEGAFQFADASAEDSDEYAEEDDNSEAYADGEEDEGPAMGEGVDDGDGDEFDKNANTHGPMKCSDHTHGKYGPHSHNNDGDHSDAPLKASATPSGTKSMSKKASERGTHQRRSMRGQDRPLTLAESQRMREELAQLREENANTKFRLYEKDVASTLEGWRRQTLKFSEGTKSGAKITRIAHIALSKTFRDRYTGFMLQEGIKLNERQRAAINGLVEMALSTAVLDLSQRGSSFDQEARRTIKGGERQRGADDSDKLQEAADRMAMAEEGRPIDEVDPAKQMQFYERAAKAIGYR